MKVRRRLIVSLRRHWLPLLPALAALALALPAFADAAGTPAKLRVTAFARLEPHDGVLTLSGPSTDFAFRVDRLAAAAGDMVKKGQPLAILDIAAQRAGELAVADSDVTLAEVQLDYAKKRLERRRQLQATSSPGLSREDFDTVDNAWQVAQVALARARQQRNLAAVLLDQSTIRAPTDGMVLRILKRDGEGVSANDGILEFGDVEHMEAVGEVFETDGPLVRLGAHATFSSPGLTVPVAGTVRFIAPKVDRISVFSPDPARNTEARIIRVYVALDDSPALRRLTNLQGSVAIDAAPAP